MTDYRFRELVDSGWLLVNDGYRAKIHELRGGGAAFLRAGALQDDGFRWEGLDSFAADAKIESKRGRAGDVVITTKGNSVGRVGWVPESAPDFVYSPHLSFWRSLDHDHVIPRYLYYWSRSETFNAQLRGLAFATDMAPYLSLRDQLDLSINLPTAAEQRRIAGVLGAFDDLIETNRRLISDLSAAIGASFARESAEAPRDDEIGDLVSSVARGVGPTYSEAEDSVVVLNQKCIRDGRANTGVARRMAPRMVRPEKIAAPGDAVVNSTGVGTLGRAARWMGDAPIHVDSHVSVVKAADPSDAGWLARALIENQDLIEGLGSGSTGQTELSRDRLLSLRLPIPDKAVRTRLSSTFDTLDASVESLSREVDSLSKQRDELLPLLMSGRVWVREVA